MSSDSSDSSDDEENDLKLLEALDPNLLSNSLYKNLKNDVTVKAEDLIETKSPQLLSARPKKNNNEFNELNVTPEFQNFVGKNLSKLLDTQLVMMCSTKKIKSSQNLDEDSGGIKLFKTSKVTLKDNEDYTEIQPKTKRLKKHSTTEIDAETLKLLAVSPEDILSQKDTKYWSNRTKRKPFEYKEIKKGLLISKNE